MENLVGLTLKTPQADAVDSVAALYVRLRGEADNKLVPDYFAAFPDDFLFNVWRDHFADPESCQAHILCFGGQEIGLLRAGRIEDSYEPFLPGPLPDATGELHQIYLFDAYQKRGFGRFLYQQALADLKSLGFRHMLICTYLENLGAAAFYRHQGARDFGTGVLDMDFNGVIHKRPVRFMLHENI